MAGLEKEAAVALRAAVKPAITKSLLMKNSYF
jgi:hypothetical protein